MTASSIRKTYEIYKTHRLTNNLIHMIKAGIVEGTGYKAGELIRLLLNHPDVQLMWVSAEGREGVPVSRLHRGLTGDTDLRTTDRGDLSVVNVVFLCHPDGNTASWLAENAPGDDVCVIDLSADYRTADGGKTANH